MRAPQVSEHPSGTVIDGRYRVEGTLGRGGMGSVYRVRDANTGNCLALKRSWSRDSARAARRRLLLEREFHMLAHLRHPRIIEVYDYGSDEFGPYYTMELLGGADLDKAGPLPWQEACVLVRDIASSLAIVHSRGLIHRDVSTRNVRRTADGRAKLIDFGAMVSMGVANDVVGTAPFIAPEVLQMQALDARVDLFSLGALAYHLLTGRHAFPARRSSELRDLWRSRPASPSRLVPEIPAALSALVMGLLSLDRGARPQSAAEVMERLCVIGSLPREELPEVQRAYLTTPTLVGRQASLLSIRTAMVSLVRGDGGALLVEGSAGSGRSRMLDASAFEGKLLSAAVVRADAGDAIEPWGVARAIASQLFGALPQESIEATRLSASVLAHVIHELRDDDASPNTVTSPERGLLLRELRDFVLTLAQKQRIVIVVDDTDRIDEPSAAWLAALAHKAERLQLMLVMSMEPEDEGSTLPSLQLVRSIAQRVALPPLDAEQTESLVRSVFGDVPNVGLFAGRVYARAQGNPRATMELAQHLVDAGIARYEGGSWVLPQLLDAEAVPATLSDSLARRLDTLSADAADLVEALAVAEGLSLPLAGHRELTVHNDQNRFFSALEELVAARILVAGTERYRFSQRRFVPVVLSRLAPARKAALHARLADLLGRSAGDVVERAQHLLLAGLRDEAVQLLCSLDLQAREPPLWLLEEAVAHAEQSAALPARAVHHLRMALLVHASLVIDMRRFRPHLPPVIRQLQRDSGLELYRELRDVPEATRLSEALTQQQKRYLATPERDQVLDVAEAIRELARFVSAGVSIASAAFDLELCEQLPSLEPFLPLSPSLRVVEQVKSASEQWMMGRIQRACEIYEEALARLEQPDRAGIDGVQLERLQLALQYILALAEANWGNSRAELRAQFLEARRVMRVNAWRVRSLLQLTQGDAAASRKSARRAELLQLQDDREHYQGTSAAFQLSGNFMAADLVGVKNAVDLIAKLARDYPGWQSMSSYAQSCYRYLLGDLEAALDLTLAGLELAQPGRQAVWGLLAAQHVKVLRDLGRIDQAIPCARAYLQISDAQQLSLAQRYVSVETARTLAEAGEHAQAVAMIDPVIEQVVSSGTSGLALGTFYEARAHIAIAMRDRESFRHYADLCAHEYRKGNHPPVLGKLIRLMERAQQHGLADAPSVAEAAERVSLAAPDRQDDDTIVSRILECVDGGDRARCALTVLLQRSDAYLGYLYGAEEAGLIPLAGIPDTADTALERWLNTWVRAEREAADHAAAVTTASIDIDPRSMEPTETRDEDEGSQSSAEYSDSGGRRYHAFMLTYDQHGQRTLVGVLAVQSQQRRQPPLALLRLIAGQLLAHHDVRGIALPTS